MAVNLKLKNNALIKGVFNKKLSYIESTGTQYIDTGIRPDDNSITFKIGISFISDVIQNNTVSGAEETNRGQATSSIFRNSSGHLAINWGNWTSSGTVVYQNCPVDTLMELEIKAGSYVKVNGNTTSVIPNNVSYSTGKSANFILCGISDASRNSIRPTVVRTYYFVAVKNNVELIHLIPIITGTGKPGMYDTVSNTYYYNNGTGDFVAGYLDTSNLENSIATAYVKDCPNVSGINILRQCPNLTRVRLDIGNVSGSLEELLSYSTLNGFNDNYESQTKPRIIGTWTINSYHTNAEKNNIDIDGLTVLSDNNYNIDYLLENNLIAVQTIDSTKEGYNQPVADVLIANNIGHTTVTDSSKFFITKNETAAVLSINNMFNNNTSIVTFNEFKYFDSIKTTTSNYFAGCTSLKYISIPSQLHNWSHHIFNGCSSLEEIHFLGYVRTSGNYVFSNTVLNKIYFENIDDLFNSDFYDDGYNYAPFSASGSGHVYIGNQELINVVVPNNITSINRALFMNCKYIESVSFNETLTEIKNSAFKGCSGITGNLVIPSSVTSIGKKAFDGCSGLTGDLVIPDSVKTIDEYAFSSIQFENAILPKTLTSCGNLATVFHGSKVVNLTIGCSSTLAIVSNASVWYGNGNGTLRVFANCSSSGTKGFRFKNVFIYGSMSATGNYCYVIGTKESSESVHSIRIRDTVTLGNYGSCIFSYSSTPTTRSNIHYIELYDFVRNSGDFFYTNNVLSRADDCIVHFRRNTLPTNCPGNNVPVYKVGEGISKAADDATLALYLADSNWSAYSSKLGTWYDYNGEFKWYYITDNLTDCINTNPDEWPHITRGESYETTIEPLEGMTLSSVQVQMLDTDITSPTYDTLVDITSTVYDSSTGEIDIPSVTGNVVITATAN